MAVEYKYDAWGEPVGVAGSLTATLGEMNPFRYRGYVWDGETELYYLRSRYYNPFIERFHNSDSVIVNKQDRLTENVYTYCSSSPLIMGDFNGEEGSILLFAYVKNGELDWGHSEIGYKKGKDIKVYAYGRYADDADTYDLVGKGILVIYNDNSSWKSQIKKGRSAICVELRASDEEINKLENYFSDQIDGKKRYKGKKVGNKVAYDIDTYNIAINNCTTKTYEALRAAYDSEILDLMILYGVTPHMFYQKLEALSNSDNEMVISTYDNNSKENWWKN